jgi:hypothetical protein
MIESSLAKMSTDSYATQIQGIDEGLEVVDILSTEIIRVLAEAEDSLFVAERVSNIFGSLLRKLNRVFDETNNLQLKFNIAIIYVTNDINTKIDFLLQYARETENLGDATFCLMKLSQKGIGDAEPIIEMWMDRIKNGGVSIDEVKREDYLQMLVDAHLVLAGR